MRSTHARRTPLSTAAFAQFQLLFRLVYPVALITLLLMGTFAYYESLSDSYYNKLPPWRNRPAASSLLVYLAIIGGVAALFTWVNQPPRKRQYHYSLPVGRVTHNLLRLLAGALWLIISLIVFCIALAFAEDPLMFKHWLIPMPVFWFAVFAVPLLTFLLCSAIAVAFEWPTVWVLGIIAAFLLAELPPVEKVLPELTDVGAAILSYDAPLSFTYVMAGYEEMAPWIKRSQALRVFNASADAYYAKNPSAAYAATREQERINVSQPGHEWQPRRSWFRAVLIWYVLAGCALALALMRRPVG